ncbi:MAG: isoprenyl transferase [Candidatus Omnitrophica bacterium]|nr:isoprenyl transferase [Candidatus Omnitrophota bacterium]
MDGNGRWAEQKGLAKIEGHRVGGVAVEEAIKGCLELGVKVLSLYTFSTENWQRPKKEVMTLMKLLKQYLKSRLKDLNKNKIRLVVSGERAKLPQALIQQIDKTTKATEKNSRMILNLALNYGGREEIVNAARAIAQDLNKGRLQINQIDQEIFSSYLYTRDLPDPDLLIRTSGEYRISNFFLWQISYSEFYFTDKLWPDFKKEDLLAAVLDYQRRERRFGR